MQQPEVLYGAGLWSSMKSVYRSAVQLDSFEHLHGDADPDLPRPVHHFATLIGWLFEMSGDVPIRLHGRLWRASLDLTVRESFHLVIEPGADSPPGLEATQFGHLVELALAIRVVPGLIAHSSNYDGGSDVLRLLHLVRPSGRATDLSFTPTTAALMDVFLQEAGDKSLWDYFKRSERNDAGFLRWWPESFTEWGVPLKRAIASTGAGKVKVDVSRYQETDDQDVHAYEWQAGLFTDEGRGPPDAVASGMFYKMERFDGACESSPSDLRWAADAVADADVSQVLAFFAQHADAEDLMQLGDICFVWMWEKREGVAKGAGADVLRAAVKDLKRRFSALKTVVILLEPAQFRPVQAREPSEVQVARQVASEALEDYARSLGLERELKSERPANAP